MRLLGAILLSTAIGLSAASAAADPPASAPAAPSASAAPAAPAEAAAPAEPAVKRRGFLRPALFGLVAMAFLVFGAAVGANDRSNGDAKS